MQSTRDVRIILRYINFRYLSIYIICIHAYVNDLQTYISCAVSDQSSAISRLLECAFDQRSLLLT